MSLKTEMTQRDKFDNGIKNISSRLLIPSPIKKLFFWLWKVLQQITNSIANTKLSLYTIIKRGHNIVPRHQEKSWQSIQQPMVGGRPRLAEPILPAARSSRPLAKATPRRLKLRPSSRAPAAAAAGSRWRTRAEAPA
jgi:hypothetical protein